MSNRLYGKDRIYIALTIEGADPFDHARINREAEILRGEALVRMIIWLWRAARAASQRLLSPQIVGHDAAASPR